MVESLLCMVFPFHAVPPLRPSAGRRRRPGVSRPGPPAPFLLFMRGCAT
jgi:hypothetical protein